MSQVNMPSKKAEALAVTVRAQLLGQPHLWSRKEVLTPSCVPRAPGVYAWFFTQIPASVPTAGCIVRHGRTLLYFGIAPKAPSKNGRPASARTLRDRIRQHMRGNAYGSTLRRTLGCLLAGKLGIELRRVGSGKRTTFTSAGEEELSKWMGENAYVCWIETQNPWKIESELINSLSLPLNLEHNRSHPFHPTLTALRRAARQRADELPIVRKRTTGRGSS